MRLNICLEQIGKCSLFSWLISLINIIIFRLPDNDVKLLLFILFLPFGLLLFLLRSILILSLFILGYVVSDTGVTQKIFNKIATLAFGISVSIENPKKKENVDVYISNSLSIFDHLAVNVATGAVAVSFFYFNMVMLCSQNYVLSQVKYDM